MSAPSSLVGDVMKGLAERAENLGGTTRAGRVRAYDCIRCQALPSLVLDYWIVGLLPLQMHMNKKRLKKQFVAAERKRRASQIEMEEMTKKNMERARRASVSNAAYAEKQRRRSVADRARRASVSGPPKKPGRKQKRRAVANRRASAAQANARFRAPRVTTTPAQGSELMMSPLDTRTPKAKLPPMKRGRRRSRSRG